MLAHVSKRPSSFGAGGAQSEGDPSGRRKAAMPRQTVMLCAKELLNAASKDWKRLNCSFENARPASRAIANLRYFPDLYSRKAC